MRPLHRAELRGLVETLLNHSFGHHFKQNINQARSVWAKAQICQEDLQAWENAVQFLHLYTETQTCYDLITFTGALHSSNETPFFSNTSFKLYATRRCELPLSPALQGKKKRLWLLCLEVCVHLQEGFAEEQNLFHCRAEGTLVKCSSPNLTCAAVDNCSPAKRGNGTRCDGEQDSISRNEELFLLEVAGGLWFSTGVRSTEMKFVFCVKCWGAEQCCYGEWRCRMNSEFNVSVLVNWDFTCPLWGPCDGSWQSSEGLKNVLWQRCVSCFWGFRSWLCSLDTALLAFSGSPWLWWV